MPKKLTEAEEKKCTWCRKPATKQTEQGKYNESLDALPINHGWYCDSCFKKGLEMENEAIYG